MTGPHHFVGGGLPAALRPLGTEPWRNPMVEGAELRRRRVEVDAKQRKAKEAEDAAIAWRTTVNNAIVVAVVVIGIACAAWGILVSMPPGT